ncbi:unnamed protein product [Withania somnifera]
MGFISAFTYFLVTYMVLSETFFVPFSYATNTTCPSGYPENGVAVDKQDVDKMQFAVNLEFLEAEYFLWAAYGHGLDVVAPNLTMGGPPPIGVRKANLDPLTKNIIVEFAYQEVGHLRALKSTVGVFPRPLLDLSAKNFGKLFDKAFGHKLVPPFDPYRDSLSYMLSCYVIPYVGLVGYVGTNPNINGYKTKRFTLTHILSPISLLVYQTTRNKLAKCGIKDEGIFVHPQLGAENRTRNNNTCRDFKDCVHSGDEHVHSGFYPNGANGKIARNFPEPTKRIIKR